MKVTLDSYEIANGEDRIHQVPEDELMALVQETPEAVYVRAEWPAYFPDRAVCRVPLSYPVVYPECASAAAAHMQAHQVMAECPKGGVLITELDGERARYASSRRGDVRVERMGRRNLITFSLEAVNPTFHHMVLDAEGTVMRDGEGNELEY